MKKIVVVLTLVLAVSMSLVAVHVYARGWSADPGNDPVFTKFLDETADIRKEIALDRAELNALMAGENPDAKRVRELTASIAGNQEKLAEIARASDIGAPGTEQYGRCGGRVAGRGGCGSCAGAPNAFGNPGVGGYGSCGTPGCPGAGPGR
ncbi:MAG: hypothetical protein M8357_02425 [Desulfobulbaceae bacterium]|nr:hypothetical protein [Desulfobulbaceae bacterium]